MKHGGDHVEVRGERWSPKADIAIRGVDQHDAVGCSRGHETNPIRCAPIHVGERFEGDSAGLLRHEPGQDEFHTTRVIRGCVAGKALDEPQVIVVSQAEITDPPACTAIKHRQAVWLLIVQGDKGAGRRMDVEAYPMLQLPAVIAGTHATVFPAVRGAHVIESWE